MNKNITSLAMVVVGLLGIVITVSLLPKQIKGQYDDYNVEGFVSCLNDKGAVMYGSYSCAYCQKQKREFGASFSKLQYIECSKEVNKCVEANIKGTPTWIFSDGSRIDGYLPLPQFAEKVGCPLTPKENK
jgi:thioredoxin-related protein